jgi:hypothetical protein
VVQLAEHLPSKPEHLSSQSPLPPPPPPRKQTQKNLRERFFKFNLTKKLMVYNICLLKKLYTEIYPVK